MTSRTGGGKEVLTTAAVAVGVGVGVAALAGLGLAGAAFGAGVLSATAASNYARRARPSLQPSDIRRDPHGCIENWPQLLKAVQNGGVAPELRAELWPLLLGVFPSDSSEQQRNSELEKLRRLYIKLVLVCHELDSQLQALRSSNSGNDSSTQAPSGGGDGADGSSGRVNDADAGSSAGATAATAAAAAAGEAAGDAELAPADSGTSARSEAGSANASTSAETAALGGGRRSPLPLPGNLAAFAEAHRIIVMDAVRTDLRRDGAHLGGDAAGGGGSSIAGPTLTILPVSCGDGLPEMMMVSPPQPGPAGASSAAELAAMAAEPGAAAAAATGKLPRWRSQLADDMLWGAGHLDEPTRCQMLRLANILSAYSVHDPETGYCQGMSDLASVFVQLFDDDALAFACFERLMRSARRNFKHDETGIRHQLHQIARVLRDTDPSLYNKLQQLGAEDCMFAYRMVVVMLRRELPPAACCTLWEMQWAHQAAAEAEAGSSSGSSSLTKGSSGGQQQLNQQPAVQQPQRAAAAAATGEGLSSSTSSSSAATAAASAGLRTTVQGLSEATASARAAAAAGEAGRTVQRTSSGGGRAAAAAAAAATEPPEFVLQFIAAVVRAQRARVIMTCQEHDDVLRLFNSLTIDFWLAVAQARKQHKAYSQGPAGTQRM